jgi:uncharacterized membrane protein YphA (DoxX/SURF4 family)
MKMMNTQNKTEDSLYQTWWLLRITFGVVPIVAGIDKFLNIIAEWSNYLSPLVADMLPVALTTFMMVIGVVEIVAGVTVLTRFTREGAYIITLWLLVIAVNVAVAGYLDIAVRDAVMAVGAFTLARISEVMNVGVGTGIWHEVPESEPA